MRGIYDVGGLKVVTSPLAPRRTIYLVDPAAFDVVPVESVFPGPVAVEDASRFILGMEVALHFRDTELERDPMMWPRPRTLRMLGRQMRAIVGYEFRKAAGRLRHVPRRRHAIITGITS